MSAPEASPAPEDGETPQQREERVWAVLEAKAARQREERSRFAARWPSE